MRSRAAPNSSSSATQDQQRGAERDRRLHGRLPEQDQWQRRGGGDDEARHDPVEHVPPAEKGQVCRQHTTPASPSPSPERGDSGLGRRMQAEGPGRPPSAARCRSGGRSLAGDPRERASGNAPAPAAGKTSRLGSRCCSKSMTDSGALKIASATQAGSSTVQPVARPPSAPSTTAIAPVAASRCPPGRCHSHHLGSSRSGTLSDSRARYGEANRAIPAPTAVPTGACCDMTRKPTVTG